MITSDLIEYIKSQLDKNISKDSIISDLSEVGWRIEDINEGFSKIEESASSISVEQNISIANEVKPIEDFKTEVKPESNFVEKIESKKAVDPYREFPDGIDIDQLDPYQQRKIEEVKTVEEKPVIIESPVVDTPVEPLKIWTPMSIKPKVEETATPVKYSEPVVFSSEKKLENYHLELPKGEEEIPSSVAPVILPAKDKQEDLIPLINKNPFPEPVVRKESVLTKSDAVPSIDRAPSVNTYPETVPLIKKMDLTNTPPVSPSVMKDIVPKNAMISSYSQDILSASKEQEVPVKNKKGRLLKIGILLVVLGLVGGMVFAFVEGYIKIPWSNMSIAVVKKDPKTFLMDGPKNISKLKSYKVDTNIDISTPSLSSITTGLASGEAVNNSKDRDFVSVVTKGVANHTNGGLNFDYLVDFKSSILKNDISSDLKYDGDKLYATVPDLKEILDKDSPQKATVSFTPDQISMVIDQLSPDAQELIKKLDVYDIASGKIPLYVKNKISLVFREFISSLTYVEKGKENIHGVETYHYEITADRQSTKKLLVSLSDLFVTSITDEKKKELDEMLGSSSISAFDVWVGANDDNIYQIKFTLNAPLSQVLGLNDSGIAGNEMKIDWTTTYYDLDKPNEITVLDDNISMEDFVNGIKDLKVKNIISAFKPQTITLRNAIGSYGLRANPTGSCTNPNPGSLFSPQGHKKGSESPVGAIANSMNSLLSTTSGAGLCFSTSKDWALSVPLASLVSGAQSFYCADSAGNLTTMAAPIKGTICK